MHYAKKMKEAAWMLLLRSYIFEAFILLDEEAKSQPSVK